MLQNQCQLWVASFDSGAKLFKTFHHGEQKGRVNDTPPIIPQLTPTPSTPETLQQLWATPNACVLLGEPQSTNNTPRKKHAWNDLRTPVMVCDVDGVNDWPCATGIKEAVEGWIKENLELPLPWFAVPSQSTGWGGVIGGFRIFLTLPNPMTLAQQKKLAASLGLDLKIYHPSRIIFTAQPNRPDKPDWWCLSSNPPTPHSLPKLLKTAPTPLPLATPSPLDTEEIDSHADVLSVLDDREQTLALLQQLLTIDSGKFRRNDWLTVAVACRESGVTFEEFHQWCAKGANYSDETDCQDAYNYHPKEPTDLATLAAMSKKYGVKPPRQPRQRREKLPPPSITPCLEGATVPWTRFFARKNGSLGVVVGLENAVAYVRTVIKPRFNLLTEGVELPSGHPLESHHVDLIAYDMARIEGHDGNGVVVSKPPFDFQLETVKHAVRLVARENAFNPVQSWINSTPWDGKPRFDGVVKALGTELNDYSQEAIRVWLLGSVRRAFDYGCQHDYLMILRGEGGDRKTQALRALMGGFITETALSLDKEGAMQCWQSWCVVYDEVSSSFRRADRDALKRHITQCEDNYVPKFSNEMVRRPRRCTFAACLNDVEFLTDPSRGVRRYVIFECANANTAWLHANAQQVFAEAKYRLDLGETNEPAEWFEEQTVARADDYRLSDDASEQVVAWLRSNPTWGGTLAELRAKVTTVGFSALNDHQFCDCLRRCGWVLRRSAKCKRWINPRSTTPDQSPATPPVSQQSTTATPKQSPATPPDQSPATPPPPPAVDSQQSTTATPKQSTPATPKQSPQQSHKTPPTSAAKQSPKQSPAKQSTPDIDPFCSALAVTFEAALKGLAPEFM